jgi:twitching motility two-component system response regulator PilH
MEGSGMSATIMIVEDDEELQELYLAMLGEIDYQIVQAFDGVEALQKLEETRPDVMLLDIILDEMMGDELYMRLKQDPRYAKIPIIIVSVLPVERCQRLLDMDSGTVFLRKPFRRRQLVDAIERSCAKVGGR